VRVVCVNRADVLESVVIIRREDRMKNKYECINSKDCKSPFFCYHRKVHEKSKMCEKVCRIGENIGLEYRCIEVKEEI